MHDPPKTYDYGIWRPRIYGAQSTESPNETLGYFCTTAGFKR